MGTSDPRRRALCGRRTVDGTLIHEISQPGNQQKYFLTSYRGKSMGVFSPGWGVLVWVLVLIQPVELSWREVVV